MIVMSIKSDKDYLCGQPRIEGHRIWVSHVIAHVNESGLEYCKNFDKINKPFCSEFRIDNSPSCNIYVSEKVGGQRFRVALPGGWVANK